jgi:hypothetical protein
MAFLASAILAAQVDESVRIDAPALVITPKSHSELAEQRLSRPYCK